MTLKITISGEGTANEIIASLKGIIDGMQEGLMEPDTSPIVWEDNLCPTGDSLPGHFSYLPASRIYKELETAGRGVRRKCRPILILSRFFTPFPLLSYPS